MRILLTILSLSITTFIFAQNLDVEGDIKISSSGNTTPAPGTIRWTGSDFLGWNGTKWISLTSGIAFEGEVTDTAGNTYRTITIGSQEWMAENLRTTHYADGTIIPQVNNNGTWAAANYGAWCWYDTSSNYELPYGKLYNWYAVNDGRGLCPNGWHMPSDAEWTTLIDFLDPEVVDPDAIGTQSSVAGGKMKESGTAHWNSPNTAATNESGFSGLPGGFRFNDGSYITLGNDGYWWSSTESGANAWFRVLFYSSVDVSRSNNDKRLGFSVRCLRD
ncbi:MAG: hypothetical protein HKN87_05935 [Saprospiraceae bacterium]|nr:hypothetical protein [Saprospiraceae bacterium]